MKTDHLFYRIVVLCAALKIHIYHVKSNSSFNTMKSHGSTPQAKREQESNKPAMNNLPIMATNEKKAFGPKIPWDARKNSSKLFIPAPLNAPYFVHTLVHTAQP